MRALLRSLLCCTLAVAASGQFRGGGMRGGFGHPGFGHRGFASFGPGRITFGRSAFFPGGFRFHQRPFFGTGFGLGFGGGFYSYPVFAGGFGYWDPFYPPPPAYAYPPVTVVYPYPVEPPAPVVVTQTIERARPALHEYQDGRVIYLIAFKDQVIRAALTYWTEGDALHYLTLKHEQKTAPLDTVDRAFSEQLNRDRHVPFQLP